MATMMDATGAGAGAGAARPGDARFWDRIADRYAKSTIADPDAYARKLAETQALFTPESEVIEFGCGTGMTAVAHAPHVRRLVATDLSDAMLDHGRRRAADAGVDNIVFERASADAYPGPSETFDVALALSLLHLVRDRPAALREIRRVLKPGGAFVSSTACIGDWWGLFRVIRPVGQALGVFPHVAIISETRLVADIEAAGFEIERRWRPGPKAGVFIIARKPKTAHA